MFYLVSNLPPAYDIWILEVTFVASGNATLPTIWQASCSLPITIEIVLLI